eukprot:3362704-Rhodomonas_salina.1
MRGHVQKQTEQKNEKKNREGRWVGGGVRVRVSDHSAALSGLECSSKSTPSVRAASPCPLFAAIMYLCAPRTQ